MLAIHKMPVKLSTSTKAASRARRLSRRRQLRQPVGKQVRRTRDAVNAGRQIARTNVAKDYTDALAQAMALPGETSGIRLPTSDMPRSSALMLRDQYTVTTSVYNAAGWGSGDLLVSFYGQPGRLAMLWTDRPSVSSIYDLQFPLNSVYSAMNWLMVPGGISGTVEPNELWPLNYAVINSGPGVHGKTMSVGKSKNGAFIFMDRLDTISVPTISSWTTNATGNLRFTVLRYVGPNDAPTTEKVQTITLNGSGQFPAGPIFTLGAGALPGYFALEFTGIYVASGAISSDIVLPMQYTSASQASAAGGWIQRSCTDLDSGASGDPAIASDVRVNAASLLLTNTTAAITRQGTVLAARFRTGTFATITPTLLSRCGEKYTGDAAHGVYTFKEFTNYAEQFRDCNAVAGTCFDLDYDDYFHFVQITCPGSSTSANTYTMSLDTSLEFKTDIARYVKGVSPYAYSDLIRARHLINSNPNWFYENPTHMRNIYNFIRRGARGAYDFTRTYGPRVARATSILAPASALTLEALAQALQQLPSLGQ